MTAPDTGQPRVGRVVEMGNRILSKKAIAIAESDAGVTVASKADAPIVLSAAQFDGFGRVPVDGPAVVGAAGRLWLANLAKSGGTLKAKWASEPVDAAAAAIAVADISSRRAATLDAIALKMDAWVNHLNLSANEIAWYRACAAGAAADVTELIAGLETLPPGGYAPRVGLLLKYANVLLADPSLGTRARALLEPFIESSADARALRAALASTPDPEVLDLSRSLADRIMSAGGQPDRVIPNIPAAISAGDRLPTIPAGTPVERLRSLDAFAAGRSGVSMNGSLPLLAGLSLPLLDDLVDGGALTQIPSGAGPWSPEITAYLRCRTDPAAATLDELRLTGFTAELARRFAVAGDDAELGRLDATEPAVGHYQAVRAYQLTGTLTGSVALRPAVRTVLEQVEALRQPEVDGRREARAELAADSSAWPLIRELAYRGDIWLSPELRESHPNFGAWLDLCGMQRLVFDGRWTDVITAGRRLASSPLESMRDEAESMVAFAEWQLGHPAEALRLLDNALAGQFSTGLIVNAALVAAEQGCKAAFPYLIKAMRLATDSRVRQGAVSRALGLWMADNTVQDYPDALARMVRESLAIAQPDDEFHCRLLFMSTLHDRAWLASATVVTTNPVQVETARYFVTRSRVLSEDHRDTFDDLITLIVKLNRVTPAYSWMAREKTWLTELFMDLVHTSFGEAAWTSSSIALLVNGGILTLAEELILSMQAGAHVAMKLSDDGAEISTDAERRLIFAQLDKYRSRRGELNEIQREIVDDEVARCAVAAALAFAATTERMVDVFGNLWDELVARERWDYQNRAVIIGRERSALNDLATYVERCRRYLASLDGLVLNENAETQRGRMVTSVNVWASEIARLRSLL